MLARRFLGCVLILIIIAVAGAFAFFQFGSAMLVRSATPQGNYQRPAPSTDPDYADPGSWISRPGSELPEARWSPDGVGGTAAEPIAAATFYIHPTTYLLADRWNAPLKPSGQAGSNLRLFLKSQASAFNRISSIWAPHYRQAAYGAFLLDSDNAHKALDLAYGDVRNAFDRFLAEVPAGTPIILAGHSQGSLHLTRLLADRKQALSGRLVAAYVAGWPVGARADLPVMGVSACKSPQESGCLLSWQSFSEPANTKLVTEAWVGTRGLTGATRAREDMLCVNPITGVLASEAPPSANIGTLVPNRAMEEAKLTRGAVGARCDHGFLKISGDIPDLGPFVLPGNNYHVYDYALFWANVRADADRRLQNWARK
ncbi:DUF3089 domain-containing protein [Sphingomonas sp. HDW15A]|uniref:DUF3089 domain-containing protein n=1 Tax=Sphingomonas sp. HDW15A TaxID=2714942 RepID=UPI0014091037|nr:DUF3089 domain-containing protein [Sphingomonas sp. HDW15A]QIK96001.1 DUF3089 domain-containing protein [Sphingomonas sp. HDW15A]